MKVYVGGYLTFYMPDKQPEFDFVLTESIPVRKLLIELNIPLDEVQLVILNDKIVDLDQVVLVDHDVLKVFPGLDGG
jgi:hypothetical protein